MLGVILVAIGGLVLLACLITAALLAAGTRALPARIQTGVANAWPWVPAFALLLVWSIAVGTRLATGDWPVRCEMLMTRDPEFGVTFVGMPPDGNWGLLRFAAQLALASSVGVLLGLPVAHLIERNDTDRSGLRGWRRSGLVVTCCALIVASYWTTPGQRALDWIID